MTDDGRVDEQGRAPGWEAAMRANDRHAVRITGTGLPGSTGVEVDGTSIVNGLAAITIAISGDELPRVTLRLIPAIALDLGLDPAKIDLDHGTAEALTRLGWAPPRELADGPRPGYSTPASYADGDEVIDSRGKRWRYSAPCDTWGVHTDELGGSIAPHSHRSWQRLLAEFGPLTDAGSR